MRQQKLHQIGICGYIIQLIKFLKKIKKHSWQKNHLENQTGTENRNQPTRITKKILKRNMNPGSKIYLYLFIFFISINFSKAEEKL